MSLPMGEVLFDKSRGSLRFGRANLLVSRLFWLTDYA
jgi:hypothetical protein